MLRNSAFIMIAATVALLSLGLVMLTSVSAFAPANQGNAAHFITRQSIWLVLGVIACLVASRVDYHVWLKYRWWLLGGSVLLMLLCFVPGIGLKIKGAHRWLDLGVMRLQPMEPFKISVVIMLLVFTITFIMLFIAGTKLRYLAPLPLAGFFGILTLAIASPQKRDRILAFLNPEEHITGAGWQLHNALVAFGSGGVSGRGLGNSIQKMKWLPESHTDFIFPIIGEELGLIFSLGVVLCFLLMCLSAGIISCHAPEPEGVYLGVGLTSLVGLQAIMNIAVVTGLMPTKGIGLPFISYGGSNLLLCMFCVGLLLNIHRNAVYTTTRERRGHLPPVIPERL